MRILLRLATLALALALLAACGGPPVVAADLPVYPEATAIEPGASEIADAVIESMRGAAAVELAAEFLVYELPAGTDWPAVQVYYGGALAGSDWLTTADLSNETPALSTTGWQRRTFDGEQALMISYIPEPQGGAPLLIVSLFSKAD